MMCITGNWLKTEQRQNLLLSDVQAGTIHHTHVHCFQRQIKPLWHLGKFIIFDMCLLLSVADDASDCVSGKGFSEDC